MLVMEGGQCAQHVCESNSTRLVEKKKRVARLLSLYSTSGGNELCKTYRFKDFQLLGQQLGELRVAVVGCYHGNVVAVLQ